MVQSSIEADYVALRGVVLQLKYKKIKEVVLGWQQMLNVNVVDIYETSQLVVFPDKKTKNNDWHDNVTQKFILPKYILPKLQGKFLLNIVKAILSCLLY